MVCKYLLKPSKLDFKNPCTHKTWPQLFEISIIYLHQQQTLFSMYEKEELSSINTFWLGLFYLGSIPYSSSLWQPHKCLRQAKGKEGNTCLTFQQHCLMPPQNRYKKNCIWTEQRCLIGQWPRTDAKKRAEERTFHVTKYLLFFVLKPATFTRYPRFLVMK